jgi:acyl-coenzyme A thioesterase PaaI-like protein
VIEAEVANAEKPDVIAGLATMTFSVLERRAGNPVIALDNDRDGDGAASRQLMTNDGSGFDGDAYECFGIRQSARPGEVQLAPAPYIENSLGAVQGGVLASLADAATASALGAGFETVDLQLFYLALAKDGPIRARAEVLARGDRWGSVAVEIDDLGARRHTCAVTAVGARW